MLQPLLETFLRLQSTNQRRNRTARPSLALPDRLQPAEATKAGRLEVAMAAAAGLVVGVVATEALLHPAADDRSSSTMSVILSQFLYQSEGFVNTDDVVAVHRWLARSEGLVSSSWYVPSPRTNATIYRSQGYN